MDRLVHNWDESPCDRPPAHDGDLCGHGTRTVLVWVDEPPC